MGGAAAMALGPGAGKAPSIGRRVVFGLSAPMFLVLILSVLAWANVALLNQVEAAQLFSSTSTSSRCMGCIEPG